MSTVIATSAYSPPARYSAALRVLVDEVVVFAQALANPGKAVREVEQMRALHVQADRVQATDPAQAAALRQRAARMGLR